MTRLLLVTLATWTGIAAAQMDVRSAKAVAHNFSVLGSMNAGGFSLGAGYEYMYDTATGVGAHIRTFSKEAEGTGVTASVNPHHGLMIFGATLGHHFFKGKWDLAFTPSFNIISIDSSDNNTPPRPDDATTMGPGMSISLLWALTERFSAGFDYSNYWVWFEEDYRGLVISDFAIKAKASF